MRTNTIVQRHLPSYLSFVIRSYSTSPVAWLSEKISQPSQISNRKRFRDIPVDPQLLEHVRAIGVGMPDRSRKSKTRTSASNSSSTGTAPSRVFRTDLVAPLPFGSSKARVRKIAAVTDLAHCPQPNVPEIAIIGRSNVGKSTLLNSILYYGKHHRSSLDGAPRGGLPKGIKANVSNRPGETREIVFYQLTAKKGTPESSSSDTKDASVKLRLVDMPGYGFAYAKPEALEAYREQIASYLLDRGPILKRILFLLDARHGLKRTDIEFLQDLQSRQMQRRSSAKTKQLPPIQIVLTKSDLVPQLDLVRRAQLVRDQLSVELHRERGHLRTMMVSAMPEKCAPRTASTAVIGSGGILELQRELAALSSIEYPE